MAGIDGATPADASGPVDTNSYPAGDAADLDGTAYPYTIDPAETIRELALPLVNAETEVTVTTTSGATFTFPVTSSVVLDRWAIDTVTLADPTGAGARIAWWWAGE
jgi:hypothetical protein